MTPEMRTQIAMARAGDYVNIMRTTFFTFVAVAAVNELAGGYSTPLLMIAIAVTAYGVLAGSAALDDLIALRDDMDEGMAATNYGGVLKARNLPTLKMVSAALIGLIGLAQVLAILI